MRKTFVYRLYPSRTQAAALAAVLDAHRHLYNAALEQRRLAYRMAGKSLTYGQQSAELKLLRRQVDELARTNFSSCQATLRRLDRAYRAFFARGGYPRFRGRTRFRTVEFPSLGDGCSLDQGAKRVYFQHVGQLKVKWHRPLEGTIKTVAFSRRPSGWYVLVSCDLGDPPASAHEPAVGIDLGLVSFLATSDGRRVVARKPLRTEQARLRRAQRHLARCQPGSARRKKAVGRVARLHERVTNVRHDFHHKSARSLVDAYGTIVVEDLSILGLARSRLAQSVHDAAWASFLAILAHKAESAGVRVVRVDPRLTSQVCSGCGVVVPKALSVRVHACLACGLVLDRDVNAARNILRLGSSRQAITPAVAGVA